MQMRRKIRAGAPWSPILIGDLLRADEVGRGAVIARLAMTLAVLTGVSIALGIGVEVAGGYGHSIPIGGFSFAWLPHPPLVVGTLTLFWVGPAGGVLVLVASSLVFGWWVGLGMPWLAMYAGGDILLVLLFTCAFSLTGARIDLRDADSLATFLFTSLAAAISVLPAAVVWGLAAPARSTSANGTLEEWFSGSLVAMLLIVGPALRHLTDTALRVRDRLVGARGVEGTELRRYGERMLWVALAVLTLFVIAADLLLRQHLSSFTRAIPSPELRQTVQVATGVVGLFTYSLLALVIGLVYVRQRVTRGLEAAIESRTAALRRTIAELEHAQSLARTGAWQLDIDRNRVTFSNGMHDLLGVPRGDLQGGLATLAGFIQDDDRRKWTEALEASLQDGPPLDALLRMRRADGALRWVHARGARTDEDGEARFTGTFVDVTEWRDREHRLQQLTDHVDRLVRHSPAAIITLDTDGRIVLWSPAAERIFGWPAEAAVGSLPPFVGDQYRDEFEGIVRRILSGEAIHNLEIARLRADGQAAHVSLSAAPIEGDEGGVVGVLGILVDISETVAARERFRELSEQLEAKVLRRTAQLSAANENLQAFVQTASHDLQAPLRAIGSFAELLRERHADQLDERAREYLDRIVVSRDRMHRLIRDVLGYSRVGRGSLALERIDLSAILRQIAEDLSARHPEASLVLPQHPVEVPADETLVRQIFTNLLENAFVYARPGTAPEVVVGIERGHAEVTISVRDNGIGIAQRHQQQIFRAFERLHTEDEYSGTGLGLAIVRRCVDLLGWEVSVTSEPGRGSIFAVRVPNCATEAR